MVPWDVFLDAGKQVWARFAMDRMNMAQAISLAFADPKDPAARRLREDTIAEAYPDG